MIAIDDLYKRKVNFGWNRSVLKFYKNEFRIKLGISFGVCYYKKQSVVHI